MTQPTIQAPAPGPHGGTSLAATAPLLLVPVRIETRFAAASGKAADETGTDPALLLRVYPDTISISSFEPELTDDEISAGQAYWDQLWAAGSPPQDADAAQAPWRVLAAAYGPARAAWIALQLTPVNLAAQPAAPTAAGSAPTPAPQFPSPATRASSYEQAAAPQALPDFWTVALYSGSSVRQVSGGPIAPGLAVGLTPHDGTLPDGLPVDAGMRWLVDFDEAVKTGMGMRIPLSEDEYGGGFDRIIVYGVRDANADGPGDAALAALLDAHHYTDGLAFVPQGAPTNNTPDAASAFSSKDPDYAISFAVERSTPLTSAPDGDGARTARLLGIPTATFDHVRYADGVGVRNGQDMLTAVWPATLGYFMEQMMAPQYSAETIDTARAYALANAIPRGPLPALRVGSTPYGVLPATSLALSAAQAPATSADPQATLARFLTRLLPAWQASVPFAPQIGATTDPDQDLAHVLGMDASSVDFRGRQVIGDDLMWNLLSFLGLDATQEWWLEHLVRGRALLDSLGFPAYDPRVIHTSMGKDSYPVPYPAVQDGALSETEPLNNDADFGGQQVNYIEWLRNASVTDIWAQNYPGPTPTSILYRVLRQSVLREYVSLAGRAQADAGLLPPSALREQELVNIDQSAPSITPLDIISRPVTAGSSQTWAQYLHDLRPTLGSQFPRLGDLRASLDRLATVPTAELGRLLSETLDACSHRLDVWVTALATQILQAQRTVGAAGTPGGQPPGQPGDGTPLLHLGGYGWVENVRPAARTAVVTGTDANGVQRLDASRAGRLPPSAATTPAPVRQPDSDNAGFIHAPSMTQAAAGAVLRSGYLSHRGTSDEQMLAIDLSSQRVSSALWLLDGVRQGQALGALTGYQFEQGLHEQELDVYVQPFRDTYPLIGTDLTPQSAAGPVAAPSQVVDGVQLRAAWQAGALTPGGYWGRGLPVPSPPANTTQNAVLGLLSQIDDMLSALSDVSVAESVFQIMRGNFGRAGGILDAISRGDRPPDPDLTPTPRSGLDVTHRLMLLFTGLPPASPAWSGITTRPRALAEPWLSRWVASRLPHPATVRCLVTWTAGGQPQSAAVSLRDLDIGPLDVLAIADASDQPQRAELENRILYAASPPQDAETISIGYAEAGLPPGSVPFPSLLTAARAVRDMLGAARALDVAAFGLPGDDAASSGETTDLAELNGRVSALVARLQADIVTLQTAITNIAAAPEDVSAALIAASGYGVSGAIPLPGPQAGLATQASQVLSQLTQRAAAAQQIPLPAATAQAAMSVAQAILGNGTLILPHLTPPDLASLQSAFAQSAAMIAVEPQATDRWLLQLSHIRPAAERLDLASAATQLLGARRPELTLAQLPATPGDRWLGLPTDPGHPPAPGRVAIEAIATGDPATATIFAGLLLDEWLDRIPSLATGTGVSFHYNEPKARAPQTLVLATCPDKRATWDGSLVRTILEETLALAKARAVDLNAIQEVGQILPALHFPFSLQATTPATNFLAVQTWETSLGNFGNAVSGQG